MYVHTQCRLFVPWTVRSIRGRSRVRMVYTGYEWSWDNSRIRQLADCQLADWTSRGLINSRTGQLAVSQMPPKERKLSTQSRRWHPRVVQ